MSIYGPEFYDDAALIQAIRDLAAARTKVVSNGIAVIAGEGRRLEFTSTNLVQMDADLRNMLREARCRGLAIGGQRSSAIAVDFY